MPGRCRPGPCSHPSGRRAPLPHRLGANASPSLQPGHAMLANAMALFDQGIPDAEAAIGLGELSMDGNPIESPLARGREYPQSPVRRGAAQSGLGRAYHRYLGGRGLAISDRAPPPSIYICSIGGNTWRMGAKEKSLKSEIIRLSVLSRFK